MSKETKPVFDSWTTTADPADPLIYRLGIILLVAFFFPIIGDKIVFFNIVGLWERGVPGIVRIELLYPLLAGAALLVLAKKARSMGRAAALLAIGLFPFLLMLASSEVRSGLASITRNLPGGGATGAQFLLSALAIFGILGGAHASRIRPEQTLGANVAIAGAGLYFITLFIPVNRQLPIIAPFKVMTSRDPTGYAIMFLSGLTALACMVLVVLACVQCFRLSDAASDRVKTGNTAIKLWFAQFYVYGAFLLYTMIVGLSRARGDAGLMILSFLTAIGKFGAWVLGLLLLIPLGIAEFIIAAAPTVEQAPPAPAVESAPAQE